MKFMHVVTTLLRKFFKKLKKTGRRHFAPHPGSSPQRPLQLKQNPNKTLCSGDNFLQPDEEIKSLAIIVAEK